MSEPGTSIIAKPEEAGLQPPTTSHSVQSKLATRKYSRAIRSLVNATMNTKEKIQKVIEFGKQAGLSMEQIRKDVEAAFRGKRHPKVIIRSLSPELKNPRRVEAGKKAAAARIGNRKLPTLCISQAAAPMPNPEPLKQESGQTRSLDNSQTHEGVEAKFDEEKEKSRQPSEAPAQRDMSRTKVFVGPNIRKCVYLGLRDHKEGLILVVQDNKVVAIELASPVVPQATIKGLKQ